MQYSLNIAFRRDGVSHTLENADGSGVVVDTASGVQSRGEDLNGRNEIVGEAVVQVALNKAMKSAIIPGTRGGRSIEIDDRARSATDIASIPGEGGYIQSYLKLENILHTLELLLKSAIETYSQRIQFLSDID